MNVRLLHPDPVDYSFIISLWNLIWSRYMLYQHTVIIMLAVGLSGCEKKSSVQKSVYTNVEYLFVLQVRSECIHVLHHQEPPQEHAHPQGKSACLVAMAIRIKGKPPPITFLSPSRCCSTILLVMLK